MPTKLYYIVFTTGEIFKQPVHLVLDEENMKKVFKKSKESIEIKSGEDKGLLEEEAIKRQKQFMKFISKK